MKRSISVFAAALFVGLVCCATSLFAQEGGGATVTVDLGDLREKAVKPATPAYPAAGKAVRAGGAVRVKVTIDENGVVVSAEAVSGHPLLRTSSEAAARASQFAPTLLKGKPVETSGVLTYKFSPGPVGSPESERAGAGSDARGGVVVNERAVKRATPEYPPAARAVKASGAVNVKVTIDEQGNVTSAVAVSGHPLLRDAAERAARETKFSQTFLSGKPVVTTGIVVYTFHSSETKLR